MKYIIILAMFLGACGTTSTKEKDCKFVKRDHFQNYVSNIDRCL